VINRRGDCRCDSGETDFSDPACTERIEVCIRIVEENDIELRGIRVGCDHVICEVAIDGCAAVLLVVSRVLKQSHANPYHNRSLDLVPAGSWVDDSSGIDRGYYPADAQSRNLRLPSDLNELGSEGMAGKLRFS